MLRISNNHRELHISVLFINSVALSQRYKRIQNTLKTFYGTVNHKIHLKFEV